MTPTLYLQMHFTLRGNIFRHFQLVFQFHAFADWSLVKYSLKGCPMFLRGGATYINDKNTTVDTSISCVPTSPPSCYCRECIRLETVSELEGNYFCAWKNLGILLWWQHGQLLAINSLLSTNTNFPSGQSRHDF